MEISLFNCNYDVQNSFIYDFSQDTQTFFLLTIVIHYKTNPQILLTIVIHCKTNPQIFMVIHIPNYYLLIK